MKFETKYNIMLVKRYFDTGYSLTSQFKYAFIGLAAAWGNTKWITIIGIAYGLSCFPIGYLFYRFKWVEAEAEVGNRFNLFQKQVRKFIKK